MKNPKKWSNLASLWKPEACGQAVLPDRSVLIGQKLVENDKIQKFKCDILSNFQTMWKRKKPFEKKCYWSLDWSLPKDGQNVLFTLVSFHECRRLDPFCLSFSFCHLHRNPPKNWFEINDLFKEIHAYKIIMGYWIFTLFEIFMFCPKIQLWFPETIVDFFLGEKLVKMLWFWTF